MKKETVKIRELLGMKQEEIAMVLKVTRSQWAMYETGKRDLPIAAKLKLAEMLSFVQQPTSFWQKQLPVLEEKNHPLRKLVEDLLVINNHNQFVTTTKLNAIKKHYEVSINRLKVLSYFESNPKNLSKNDDLLVQVLNNRAKNEAEKKGPLLQLEYEIKLETLQKEEEILKNKLQKLG